MDSHVRLGRGLIGEVQFAAIGEDNLGAGISRSGICDGLAISGGTENNSDLVAGFKRVARPAGATQDARTVGLDAPIDDFAGAVLHVQIDLGMRVGPDEFGDGALNSDAGGFVVGGVPVMGEQDAGGKQERKLR